MNYVTAKLIDSEIKGVKKSFDLAFKEDFDAMAKDPRICEMYNTSEFTEIYTSTESMSGFANVGARETPPVMNLGDGYSKTLSTQRFAGAIEITSAERRKMKDNTTMVKEFLTRERNVALRLARREIVKSIYSIINDAFTGTSFAAPDTVALIGTHTYNSTGATFNNKATTLSAGSGAVAKIDLYGANFTDAEGEHSPINFDVFIVKMASDNANALKQLFAKDVVPTTVGNVNIYAGERTIIETPFISNADHWFARSTTALIDSQNSVKLGMLENPTFQEKIIEKNGVINYPIEGWWKYGIYQLPIDWVGSDSTT